MSTFLSRSRSNVDWNDLRNWDDEALSSGVANEGGYVGLTDSWGKTAFGEAVGISVDKDKGSGIESAAGTVLDSSFLAGVVLTTDSSADLAFDDAPQPIMCRVEINYFCWEGKEVCVCDSMADCDWGK